MDTHNASDINDLGSTERHSDPKVIEMETQTALKTISDQGKFCNDMVQKLKSKLEQSNLATKDGMSFLEVKNHLLLQYLISLTGLTLQKVSGKSIQASSYLNQLVETRTFMEKMRPIETKLKYQIDKLVSTAVQGKTSSTDPLKYRANLDDLQTEGGDDDDEEDESDDEERQASLSGTSKSGIYRPPKVAPAHFDDEEVAPSKKAEQTRKKSVNQTLIRELQEEFLDTPVEIHNMGDAYAKQLSRDVRDKQRYEETFMTRLPVTKKDKHRDKAMSTIGVLGDEITDFRKKLTSSQSGGGKGKKRKFSSGKGKKSGGSSSKKFRKR